MRRVQIILTLLTCSTPIYAAGPLPPIVEAHMRNDAKECPSHDARFEKGFVTRMDVNGDGQEDYILDYGKFLCGGSYSTFCGSAGCSTTVFASTANGYNKVFDDNVRGIQFKMVRGRYAMVLGMHGSTCNRAGSALCGEVLYWNGSTFKKRQ